MDVRVAAGGVDKSSSSSLAASLHHTTADHSTSHHIALHRTAPITPHHTGNIRGGSALLYSFRSGRNLPNVAFSGWFGRARTWYQDILCTASPTTGRWRPSSLQRIVQQPPIIWWVGKVGWVMGISRAAVEVEPSTCTASVTL